MDHEPVALTVMLFGLFAILDMRRLPQTPRIALVAVIGIAILAIAVRYASVDPFFDFTAFYCGGSAVVHHADPYLASSLRACEFAALHLGPPAIPVPQPGYDLAFFALAALVPFRIADAGWVIVICIAIVWGVVSLHRLTGLRMVSAFAFIALPVAYISLDLGQLAPLIFALICASAVAARAGRGPEAGAFAALTLIEPHVGLAVVLAVTIAVPQARPMIVVTGAFLALVALVTLGVETNVVYFLKELPLHALAESGNADQYSLAMLLHWFGASDALADPIGMVQYACMLAGGVALGASASRRTGDPGLAIVIAAAAVLLGGTFIHISEIALAIPAALVLSRSARGARRFGIIAAFALAVVWNSVPFGELTLSCTAVVCLGMWGMLDAMPARRRITAIAAAVAVYGAGMYGMQRIPHPPRRLPGSVATYLTATASESRYASAGWGLFMRTDGAHADSSARDLARKVPSWVALIFILCGGVACALPTGAKRDTRRTFDAVEAPA